MHYCLLLFKLIVWTAYVHLVSASHCDKSSSIGNEFVFGFIGGYSALPKGNYVSLLITSTTNTTTNARIVVPFINLDETRSFNNTAKVVLSSTILQYGGSPIQFKAVEVYSDNDISLVAMVVFNENTEGFLVLPTPALGTRYAAASFHPYSHYNEILVIGTESKTNIQINYTLDGKIVSSTTQIQPYETYQLSVNHDLSGAVITSNKPVAVMSGSAYSKIPVNIGSPEYLVEQLVPTKYWGHKYIVPPLYPHKFFFLKLFAAEADTEVHYYNATRHGAEYMHSGSMLEILFGSGPVVIVSNKPINVVQYNLDNENIVGNPFMTTPQSISQYMDSYKFIPPHVYSFTTTVVITIDKMKVSGLRLNGNPLSPFKPITVAVPDPLDSYVTIFANISYSTASYDVGHVDRNVYFGASLYGGYSTAMAYGYPLGFTLNCNTDQTNGSTTATTTTSQPLTVGNTTNVHPGNPWTQQPFGGNGTWCFKCEDMYSLANCDAVTRCSSDSQRCYVQRYKRNQSTYLYRSGCMEQDTCSTENHNAECHECCEGQFCNTHGCGDAGVDNFQDRGPFCFDCAYQSDRQPCNTVQMCGTNQVCSIITYKWGNGLTHTKECVDKLVCDSRAGRSVHELQSRSAPVCSHCCSKDFCNDNCTAISIPSIIG